MQVNKLTWIALLTGFICGLIVMYGGCKRTIVNNPVAQTVTKTVEIHDTTTIKVPVTQIQTVVKIVDRPVTINHTDTVEALNHFFKTFIYERQYRDTNLAVTWSDTISQNSASLGKFEYQILKPIQVTTTTTTTQISPVRNSIWVGLGVLGNKSTFGVEPMAMFENKSGKAFGGGYDLINKTILINALIKIHL
jgi:hypothetical protein